MKRFLTSQRFLAIYSGILTLTFALTVLGGFLSQRKKIDFDEVNVHRINVVEPDGTLRMVISNKAQCPGEFIKGREHPRPDRKSAGIYFYNDEGTENGGLIFGGWKSDNGQMISYGHLSFDEYEQDQVFAINTEQEGNQRHYGFSLVDQPDYSMTEQEAISDRMRDLSPDQKKVEMAKFWETHAKPQRRLYVGRNLDRSVGLSLRDAEGRERMVIEVAADGSPVIRFLDRNGNTISQLPQRAMP